MKKKIERLLDQQQELIPALRKKLIEQYNSIMFIIQPYDFPGQGNDLDTVANTTDSEDEDDQLTCHETLGHVVGSGYRYCCDICGLPTYYPVELPPFYPLPICLNDSCLR